MARDEGKKLKQDFNTAIKTAENALSQVLSAIFELSQQLGQILGRLRKQQKAQEQGLTGGSTATPEEKRSHLHSVDPADERLTQLSEKNRQLQSQLYQLRTLQGALPIDNTAQLRSQLDSLDRSLERANQHNHQLSVALAQTALMQGSLPPLSAERQAKAQDAFKQSLETKPPLPRPTPEQASELVRANVKTAFLGHELSSLSQAKAEEVQRRLDTTLGALSTQSRQLRATSPLQPPPDAPLADQKGPQIKNKRR